MIAVLAATNVTIQGLVVSDVIFFIMWVELLGTF
jgi:hypothetical protein